MPVYTQGMNKFRKKVKLAEDKERLKEILELKERMQRDLESLVKEDKIRDFPNYIAMFQVFGEIDYSKANIIGKGTFTKNYKVNHPSGETRAVKVIDLKKCRQEYANKFLPRQLNILIFLSEHQHPSILKTHQIGRVQPHVFIQSEFCKGGTLKQFRTKQKVRKKPDEAAIRIWLRQLISAIEFLHYYCIAHRNITPDNVLIQEPDSIRLSGFGFSRFCYDIETGTFRKSSSNRDPDPFLAPETIEGETSDPKLGDIWSWGAILYYLATGEPPYPPDQWIKKGIKLSTFVYKPYHAERIRTAMSDRVNRLIESCLIADASKRTNVQAIKANPWLKEGADDSFKEGPKSKPSAEANTAGETADATPSTTAAATPSAAGGGEAPPPSGTGGEAPPPGGEQPPPS